MIRLVRGLSSFKPQLLSGLSPASRAYATKRGGEVEAGGREDLSQLLEAKGLYQDPEDAVNFEGVTNYSNDLVESFESILSIQSPDSGVPDPQVSECFTFTKDSPYRVSGIGMGEVVSESEPVKLDLNFTKDLRQLMGTFKAKEEQKRRALREKSEELTRESVVTTVIKLTSTVEKEGDLYAKFLAHAANSMGVKCEISEEEPWKVHRLTLLKSPFVHKKARTQIEKRSYFREISIQNLSRKNQERLIWYSKKHLPEGVELEIKVINHVSKDEILSSPDIPLEHLVVHPPEGVF